LLNDGLRMPKMVNPRFLGLINESESPVRDIEPGPSRNGPGVEPSIKLFCNLLTITGGGLETFPIENCYPPAPIFNQAAALKYARDQGNSRAS
jgi:hypothetical protein